MADNENKKAGPPRIALGDYKAARHSLARVIRLRFRKEIDNELFRDLCYGLNILLSYDKFEKETELERRLAGLENKQGGITLSVTPGELLGLDPEARDAEIRKLLQKCGYTPAPDPGDTPEADPAPVNGSSPGACAAAPQVRGEPEAQPRRLKL